MRLRYAGVCRVCGRDLPANSEAVYERTTKTVRCVRHDRGAVAAERRRVSDVVDPDLEPAFAEPPDSGVAGASARREFGRRKAQREARVRAKHPKLGGLLLAVSKPPQSTTAWDVGARGEERLGRGLDQLRSDTLLLLHDRRIPRSKANIDHLAVTANGVFVIDAKKHSGRPQLKIEGGLLRSRVERLLVGSRDCTKLVDGVLRQVALVRSLLTDDIPVCGVLCFVEADWPLFGGAFAIRGVEALWPKKLYSQLQVTGRLTADQVARIHRELADALPPA